MKTRTTFFLLLLSVILFTATCNDDDNDNPTNSGDWNLLVTEPQGDTFVIATGIFNFSANQFSADITTSRIGGGNIVKQFEITGTMEGDTMVVDNFTFTLTDPVEDVELNGRIGVKNNAMNGNGTYSIAQPPDTLHFYGQFFVNGNKTNLPD